MKEPKFLSNRISVQIITPITEENATVNALIAQLIRQGNDIYPTFADLSLKLYSLYGAAMGSYIEKIGDKQILTLFIQGIDDRFSLENEALLEEFTKLLLDIMLKPRIENGGVNQENLAIEKENLRQNIEAEINDKRRYALKRAKDTVFKGTNFNMSKYGAIEKIKQVTPQEIIEKYFELLKTSHIEILVSGTGELEKVIPYFEEAFLSLKPTQKAELSMGEFVFTGDRVEIVEEMEINQTKLVLLFLKDKRNTNLNANVYRVANTIFGAAPFSKLFVHVREKQSLCYYVDSSYDRVTGLLSVDSGIDKKDKEKAVNTIKEQLENMQKGNISVEELKQAKLLLTNAFTALKDKLSSMEGIFLSNILMGDTQTIDEQITQVNAVTKEEIVQAFSGMELKTTYMLTPKEDIAVEKK